MRSASGSARSGDGTVTVRVDSRGQLTGLGLGPGAYQRFSPSQLAAEIQRLFGLAVGQVHERLGEVMAPLLPAGVPYDKLASGEVDIGAYLPRAAINESTFEAWR